MKTIKAFMFLTVLLIAGSISAQSGGGRVPGTPTGVTAVRTPADW